MYQVVGFKGYREFFPDYEAAVTAAKTWLKQWMQEGDTLQSFIFDRGVHMYQVIDLNHAVTYYTCCVYLPL